MHWCKIFMLALECCLDKDKTHCTVVCLHLHSNTIENNKGQRIN